MKDPRLPVPGRLRVVAWSSAFAFMGLVGLVEGGRAARPGSFLALVVGVGFCGALVSVSLRLSFRPWPAAPLRTALHTGIAGAGLGGVCLVPVFWLGWPWVLVVGVMLLVAPVPTSRRVRARLLGSSLSRMRPRYDARGEQLMAVWAGSTEALRRARTIEERARLVQERAYLLDELEHHLHLIPTGVWRSADENAHS